MAIIRPCPNHASCQPINGFQFTDDPDSPVANLSSEAPDPVNFAWTKFLYNDPPINSPNNFWNNPYGTGTGTVTCPPGTLQTSQGCQGYCELNPWSSGCAPVTREAVTGSNPGRTLFSNSEQVCVDFCDDGSQFVHSVEAGRVIAVTQGQADAIALAQCQLEVEQQKICFGTNSLPGACVDNIPYAEQIQASGGVPLSTGNAYSWEISMGSLPPGLSLNPTNGKIGGFPTTGGSYTFTIKITDGLNNSQTKEFNIDVIEIVTTSPLPRGFDNRAYSTQLTALPSGVVWTLTSGSLPSGWSLSTSGLISGPAATHGTYTFTAQATLGSISCSREFVLSIYQLVLTTAPANYAPDGIVYNVNPPVGPPFSGNWIPGHYEFYWTSGSGRNLGYNLGTPAQNYSVYTTGNSDGTCLGGTALTRNAGGDIGTLKGFTLDAILGPIDNSSLNPVDSFDITSNLPSFTLTWPVEGLGTVICPGKPGASIDNGGSFNVVLKVFLAP